ncbi:MCE family protein [Phycicoccus sp. 3266]|uniref:MCE family protein n=1 Tax=Phycicoccus sp. 3266 TaxID=2817751 RepID=UPI0028579D1B|nr:MCE family protein [Phycicoccus sp. 3266]MDR6863901.1 phospholipid/cholesterol/gamma-HCH transport system substrate-binding protein [Phycicoccus sp. 3266]
MTTPSRMPRRRALVALAVGAAVVSVSGCQGAFDLPLPGGAAQHGDVIRVTAEFADVLDLVPQSSVKVDQVTVGSVEKIELNGWTARVTLRIPKSVDLPDNAVAELKQTSLLGEKYVELAPPTGAAPEGRLRDGDNIPIDRTGRNPEVEEVLSAMSLLLNGGGVAQLKTIETELNNAMRGNQTQIRDVIKQLDTFVGGLDQQKAEIVRAIDNIDKLAAKLEAQKDDLAKALESMPKGLKVLADQRQQLVQMLQALSRLGDVGTRVISQSKADTAANLKALQPILSQLTKAGDALPKSMQLLLTYPFSDGTTAAMKGDFTNMSADLDLNLKDLAGNLSSGSGSGSGGGSGGGGGGLGLPIPLPTGTLPTGGLPSLPAPTPSSTPTTPVCSIPILCSGGAG